MKWKNVFLFVANPFIVLLVVFLVFFGIIIVDIYQAHEFCVEKGYYRAEYSNHIQVTCIEVDHNNKHINSDIFYGWQE